jgi:hypothetical protein
MKVRLEDDGLTGQLLGFLRDQGCIAYYESASGAIEAIAPLPAQRRAGVN